jgi:hypothetical protein
MQCRLTCFGFLILPAILLAQHQGPTTPIVRTPTRTLSAPTAPLLWGRSAPATHPGNPTVPPNGNHRHEDIHHGYQYRAPYPYFFGYGLPLPYAFGAENFGADSFSPDNFTPEKQETVTAAPPPPQEDSGPEFAGNAPPLYRPLYQPPPVAAPVHLQPATTLIFNDGRPSKQVHNYALTANTLYALDGDTRQEIPLSLLDVQATIDANRAAGVDFALPVSR